MAGAGGGGGGGGSIHPVRAAPGAAPPDSTSRCPRLFRPLEANNQSRPRSMAKTCCESAGRCAVAARRFTAPPQSSEQRATPPAADSDSLDSAVNCRQRGRWRISPCIDRAPSGLRRRRRGGGEPRRSRPASGRRRHGQHGPNLEQPASGGDSGRRLLIEQPVGSGEKWPPV